MSGETYSFVGTFGLISLNIYLTKYLRSVSYLSIMKERSRLCKKESGSAVATL